MPRTSGRINVSKNAEQLLKLAADVYAKHLAEGVNSPLKSLDDYNWDAIGLAIQPCLDLHKTAEMHKAKMEEAYRERDKTLPNIEEAVRGAKGILKAIYRKNPKKMGDWGFTIDDSPRTKRLSTEKEKNGNSWYTKNGILQYNFICVKVHYAVFLFW